MFGHFQRVFYNACMVLLGQMKRCFFVGLLSVTVVSGVSAENSKEKKEGSVPQGQYKGVVPGVSEVPAHVAKPGRPVKATWPGFQMRKDGSSRLFLQLTGPTDTNLLQTNAGFDVHIKSAKIQGKNTRRKLDTRFFDTPMVEARLVKKKNDLYLKVIEREKVMPKLSTELNKEGYYYLYLDFPKFESKSNDAPSATTKK
ncbi:MAG: hypothetical protein IPJ88_13605 [Myxococcales bacterium]|nr:MAG: hypothetical protein IPJ88_13605 [Myxococcales bacterium]